jgi:periplasmic copper chaperone A
MNLLEMTMPFVPKLALPATLSLAVMSALSVLGAAQASDAVKREHNMREHVQPMREKAEPVVSAPQVADVQVSQAWIRQAVKGQSGTGGFMRLISTQGATLVGFDSPVAKAELHEMAMDGNVMRMRPIDALTLPAGRPVDLKPGSYHLMLVGLKKPLKVGEMVPVTLKLKGSDGKVTTQRLQVPVRGSAPEAAADSSGAASMPEMGHMGTHMDHKHAK